MDSDYLGRRQSSGSDPIEFPDTRWIMNDGCAMVRIWIFMAETGIDCARRIYQKQDAENATSAPTRNKQNVSRW